MGGSVEYTQDNAQVPRNSISSGRWGLTFFFALTTAVFAIVTLSLAAASYVKYRSGNKKVFENSGGTITISAPELLASGLVVLILACLITLTMGWIAIYLLTHRSSGPQVPAHRGFNGVPNFFWTFGTLSMVLTWAVFGANVAFTHFFRVKFVELFGRLPNGWLVDSNVVNQLQGVGITYRYRGWALLRALDAFTWLTYLITFITSLVLLFAADDANIDPKVISYNRKPAERRLSFNKKEAEGKSMARGTTDTTEDPISIGQAPTEGEARRDLHIPDPELESAPSVPKDAATSV